VHIIVNAIVDLYSNKLNEISSVKYSCSDPYSGF